VYLQNNIHFRYLITQKSASTNNCKAAELLPTRQQWHPVQLLPGILKQVLFGYWTCINTAIPYR